MIIQIDVKALADNDLLGKCDQKESLYQRYIKYIEFLNKHIGIIFSAQRYKLITIKSNKLVFEHENVESWRTVEFIITKNPFTVSYQIEMEAEGIAKFQAFLKSIKISLDFVRIVPEADSKLRMAA